MASNEGRDGPPRVNGQAYEAPNPTFVVQGRRDLGIARHGGPVAEALRQSLDRMSAVGPDAETEYQAALATVRAQPAADVMQLASDVLAELPEDAYLDRLALVQVLTDVGDSELVALFREVITSPIPPERSSDADYKFTTRGREVIIRTTAVDGVARLAAEGSPEAVTCLLDNVTHENHTVRAACIVALQELGGEPAERARERVADEDRNLLELRRVSVYDVPQAAGGSYVRNPGVHDETPPPPPTGPVT
jgi:HEAT repeat protein